MFLIKDRKVILQVISGSCILFFLGICMSCNNRGSRDRDAYADEGNNSETAADSVYIVEVTAADYAFGMPTEIPSGWVTFRMKNMGQEVHNAVIQKYSDTLTYKALGELVGKAIKKGQEYPPEAEKPMGGPAMLSPGLTGETTVFLEPGLYGMFCFMVAGDGEVHFSKGMARPFIVKDEESGADEPNGTIDVTVSDLAINIEDPIEAGDQVFDVHFRTAQNVHLAKLGEDQTLEDVKEWMVKITNPAPFTFIGGAEEAEVGQHSTFKATLEPGRYALATYYWAQSGMAEEIIIPENGAAEPITNEPVNPPVTIRITPEGVRIPQELNTGRTEVTLSAIGDKQGNFVLSRLKKGKSVQNFKKFTEDAYVYQRIDPTSVTPPFYDVWYGTLGSNEEVRLNLDIENATYVLTGPVPPEDQMAEQWEGDEMFHVLRERSK